ncbi:hypothetical protein I6B53_00845 [Schaalia sp. 19OD2882]|uniref:hypothetical protein n=1 Tax=Schaalia sp. 19OD2882 TaxID=2794089 RepID=UPI001C1EB5CD|nr:hypothetical protein [Schaalia sp. 19OD2882]QWW19722.1 hypothetical protein I6B53_00845 [Schaalia sp. 19OD2882]
MSVEMAVGTVSVALVLALVVGLVGAGVVRSEACRAARDAAREASVGGPDPTGVALRVLGPHAASASVSVSGADRWVSVDVSVPVSVLGLGAVGQARCQARTLLEQAVP